MSGRTAKLDGRREPRVSSERCKAEPAELQDQINFAEDLATFVVENGQPDVQRA
ncbi:MAG: hypothetical protein P8L45_08780 [Longimicrobiales bacterium]|nr:hypothetical protein [Longimicrobiales bacterium]